MNTMLPIGHAQVLRGMRKASEERAKVVQSNLVSVWSTGVVYRYDGYCKRKLTGFVASVIINKFHLELAP